MANIAEKQSEFQASPLREMSSGTSVIIEVTEAGCGFAGLHDQA